MESRVYTPTDNKHLGAGIIKAFKIWKIVLKHFIVVVVFSGVLFIVHPTIKWERRILITRRA